MKKEEDINNETEQKNIGAPVDKESDDKKKKKTNTHRPCIRKYTRVVD